MVWAPARMVRDIPELAAEPHALAFWLAGRLPTSRLDWALPPDAPLPEAPQMFHVTTGRLTGV